MMRELSLAHLTILDADPLALVDAGAAGGFDAVGLRVVPPLKSDVITPVIGRPGLIRDIKARLSATGLRILDIEAVWLQPDTDLDALLPALDLGAELGAQYVLTVGFDEDRTRLVDNFGSFCAAADARGLRTMLEFIPYSSLPTLAAAHALLEETRPANAGLLVDALHLSRSGGHPRDIARYDAGLFSYIHLCDAAAKLPDRDQIRPEARSGRRYPGEGELWLDAFLNAFAPTTPIGVEAPNAALADRSPNDRAARAGDATRRLLARHGAH